LNQERIDIICYNPSLPRGAIVNSKDGKLIILKGSDIKVSKPSIDIIKIKHVFNGGPNIECQGILRYKKKTYRVYRISGYSHYDSAFIRYRSDNSLLDLYQDYDPLYFILYYGLFYDSAIYISAKNKNK